MKLLSKALLTVALGAMAAAGQAQIIIGHWLPYMDNFVSNPGYESSLSYWNTSGCYYEGDEITYESLDSVVADSHTGKYGLQMYQGFAQGYNGFYHAQVSQTLATPVPVNALWDGSVWCQSTGNYLNMIVTYTDNTQTYGQFNVDSASAAPGNNGFVQWNFLPLLNQSKTIKAIEFSCDSFDGTNVVIDDVSLTELIWIYV